MLGGKVMAVSPLDSTGQDMPSSRQPQSIKKRAFFHSNSHLHASTALSVSLNGEENKPLRLRLSMNIQTVHCHVKSME
ncbi:hypothetical protein E2C01_018493 [Portunus trituberculatus]|uniref:Uncharacterized protein n=1 Tax=Portunus trituberculatus TaxID=210409 RepID=A0A5B7DX60_PORTR|nr:hypothetical protein [Portunus trituberculatus]